jgi:hypothetical protein
MYLHDLPSKNTNVAWQVPKHLEVQHIFLLTPPAF